jgi:two-component system, cell cycle sensor histidine kinase and response regulator CckA
MQDTRRTIEAFLTLQGQTAETSPDLTDLIVQIAATTPAILFIYDIKEQRSIFLNSRIYQTLGYPLETRPDSHSDLLKRLMHPKDAPHFAAMLHEVETADDDDVLDVEYRLRHANGDWYWFSSRNVVFQRDAEGKPLQILASAEDITTRRQTEDALRDKAVQLQTILDTAVDAILTINEQGIIESFNHAAECIFDYTADEVIGKNVRMLMPEPDHSAHDAYLQRYLETGKRKIIGIGREVMGRRKDGTTLPLDLAVSEAWFGRRVFTGILRDLTEQKQQDALLRESQERLQTILDHAPASIYVKDKEGRYILSNRNCDAVLGVEPGGAIGKTDYDLFSKEFADVFYANDLAVIRADKAQQSEEKLPLDGDIRTFLSQKFPIRDGSGQPYAVCGISTDITARKRAEENLRESEARFRLLADTAPVLIWTAGTDGGCDYFNKPWLDFTRRPMIQEIGMGWTDRLHPDDASSCLDVYQTCMAARQFFRTEFRLLRWDGEYRWLLNTGAPRFSHEGTFMGYIGCCVDITEQKRLQAQLYEAQKLESLGQLAGGVAHDFNNLLTAILGYTELSLLSLPEETEVHPLLTNVQTAANRAAELTKQLLMYARRQMVEFVVIDLNTVILDMTSRLQRILGEQHELVLALSPNPCFVNANVSQMEQVLNNLVINARDAMPHGGRIVIETTSLALDALYVEHHLDVIPGDYVMFAVSDTGVGMTKEVQARIFEPFFTTKGVGRGTGLGLATSYGIIKQSKGSIWVYSEVGRGSTFKVYLPRVLNPQLRETSHKPESLPEGTKTILLVDDEPMVRDIAARTLEAQGYRVLEAGNGAEALHRDSEWQGHIDLLVTDLVMPLMDGKELAQRLLERHPDLHVLYISGYTQNAVQQQGILMPGVNLLTKPFTVAGLLRKVRETLTADDDTRSEGTG